MLNGPASAAETYDPSVMPFIGLEAASHKQQLWEWDAIAATTAAQQPVPMTAAAAFTTTTTNYTEQPFYNDSICTLVDCSSMSPSAVSASSSPSPFPQAVSASFPFYPAAAPMVPDYQQSFLSASAIKAEDVDAVSCADGVVPGAGRIVLNLGRRTYFSSGEAGAMDGLLRRSRGFYGQQYYGYGHYQHQVPRCQAEGCKADLSGAKHYHRRHKVCEFHSKAAIVVAGGAQQRFCQQCSRFHVLGEFDETKRSCRKRLAEHNRRRRKPQTQTQQQQPKAGASASESSIATTGTADALSSPGGTADVKSKHVVHNGGLKGPAISPSAPTTPSMPATASSSFVTFSARGEIPSAEAHLRASVTGLSLGGTDTDGRGIAAASTFVSNNAFRDQSAFLFTSEEKGTQQYHDNFQQETQQQLFSSSSSSNTFAHAHHNFFCSSSNDASQSTTGGCGGGGSDQSVPRSSMLHLGQNLFDVDFME